MGQQQLLLVVLGIILVGIALAVGVSLFRANAIDQKRNYVMNECINLAAMAQQYYLKPSAYGGGSSSFVNWSIPPELDTTASGTYRISSQTKNSVTIIGTGNEVVTGTDTIQVQIVVPNPPNTYQVTVIN